MTTFLLVVLLWMLQLAATRPAVCPLEASMGSTVCPSEISNGGILLHTYTRLTLRDGIAELQRDRVVTGALELDHLSASTLHEGSRDSLLSLAKQSSKAAQQAAWVAYRGSLGRVLSNLETSRHAANDQLEDTIDKFIAAQAGSEDACHAQLSEAKHQLNQLHLHVTDLSMQINATDHEVTALNAQVESKIQESKELAEKCNQELEELDRQQAEDLKFLSELRGELEEMIQIANPNVTMNQTGRQVFAGGAAVASLLGSKLQADAFRPFLARIQIPPALPLSPISTSLVQVRVQEDGEMKEVKGPHDMLTSLKSVMQKASRCMRGGKEVSLAGVNRGPFQFREADSNTEEEYYGNEELSLPASYYYDEGKVDENDNAGGKALGHMNEDSHGKPLGIIQDGKRPMDPPAVESPIGESSRSSVMIQNQSGATGDSPTTPIIAKNVHCAKTDSAKVEVGGISDAVSPPRDLTKGELAQVPCVKVNEQYFGVIWLACKETLEASVSQCLKAANATKCQEELQTLQKVYVKTYVDLARLIQSYEEKTTEGYEAAKMAIEDQCRDRQAPLQDAASTIAAQASEKIKQLEELRPKLEDASDAYHKLAEQVKKLSSQCQALPETITDLDKVRDAIRALSLCPSLHKPKLEVPRWTGSYTLFEEPCASHSDPDYDALMREACEKAFGDKYPDKIIRAASVAEMEAHAVLHLPTENLAPTPLTGPCPACEGDEADHSKSGHLRVCWKPNSRLTIAERLTTCNEGRKSIACVIQSTVPELQKEDAPVSMKKFAKLVDVLLELAIEGHPRVIRTILAKRNQVLRDFKGDQEAAVKEVMKFKEPESSISEIIAQFVLKMLPGIGLSISVVYPMWTLLRNTCLVAAVLGYDMDLEETRVQIIHAFAGVKVAAGVRAGLTMALQMAWVAFAGSVAGFLPVGDLVSKLMDLSEAKAAALEKLREGKTGPVEEDEYSQELDPEPSMQDRLAVLKEGPEEVKKHADELFAKAKATTEDIKGTDGLADYAEDLGSKSKQAATAGLDKSKQAAAEKLDKSKQAAAEGLDKLKSFSLSPWDS